jgi:hypothetical protein
VVQGGEYAAPKRLDIFFTAPMTRIPLIPGRTGAHRAPLQLLIANGAYCKGLKGRAHSNRKRLRLPDVWPTAREVCPQDEGNG